MNEEELNTLQYEVGKAMADNELFRTHKGRDELIKYIKSLGIKCSTESITRAQRKLWEIALNELEVGNYEYAFKLLPRRKDDFEEWMAKRKLDEATFKKYYGAFHLHHTKTFICRVCQREVRGNPYISDKICHNCKRNM